MKDSKPNRSTYLIPFFSFQLNIFHFFCCSTKHYRTFSIAHMSKSFWYASFIFNKTKFSNPILYLIFVLNNLWFDHFLFCHQLFWVKWIFTSYYVFCFNGLHSNFLNFKINMVSFDHANVEVDLCMIIGEKNFFTQYIYDLRIELGTFNHKVQGFLNLFIFWRLFSFHKYTKRQKRKLNSNCELENWNANSLQRNGKFIIEMKSFLVKVQ